MLSASDLLLALTATAAALHTRRAPTAAAGFALVALAAALGTARFAGATDLAPTHDALSRAAGLVGVPWIGLGTAATLLRPDDRRTAWAAAAIALLGALLWPIDAWRTAIGGAAMLGLALAGLRARQPAPALGALGVVVAGLAVAGDTDARIAAFHVALATSLAAVAAARRP
ncbi:MAG: hypothetical protein R3F59_05705 [Myxococcota bacterium]